jgi:hypothetical protein
MARRVPQPPFCIGDRAAYRAAFLRSIADYSHASASKRGTVTALQLQLWADVDGPWLVEVTWDHGEVSTVNTANLIHADAIHLEPA